MAAVKDIAMGEKLVHSGLITQGQLKEAINHSKAHGLNLKNSLRSLGSIDDGKLAKFLGETYNVPFINMTSYIIDENVVKTIPADVARKFQIMPLYRIFDTVTVAIPDPLDFWKIDDIERITGRKIKAVIAPENEIVAAIEKYYSTYEEAISQAIDTVRHVQTEDGSVVEVVDQEKEESVDLEDAKSKAEDAPVINLINSIVHKALNKRATDIHIEPQEYQTRIRFRIDGILYESLALPRSFLAPGVSRIKIMSGMDIAERRVPQDGRFRVMIHGRPVDFRVSTVPTLHGEKVVIRILDRERVPLTLDKLGFEPDVLEQFRHCLNAPHGMILVTGPTGSGKTTTLYAAISELNKSDINIMTLEDPVEYHLKGINQVQIKIKQGLTFEKGLESFLRQDPDVILVGEIRNLETAQIAIRASLTGHLLLSTLHTNSAPETMSRLIDMGVEPFLLGCGVILVVAQRLVRRLCPRCKVVRQVPADLAKRFHLADEWSGYTLYGPKGCEECDFTGYYGRMAVYELLEITDDIKEMIYRKASGGEISAAAKAKGIVRLREAALQRVREGATSLEEALSIVM